MPRQVKRGGRKLTRRAYKQGGVFSNFGYGNGNYGYGNGLFGQRLLGYGASPVYNSWGGFFRRLFYGW